MNNMINIKFMTDEALNTLKSNTTKANNFLKEYPEEPTWLSQIYEGQLFVEKKYKIPNFDLKLSDDGDYSKVDLENSITLYDSLKNLPRYILTDERFWAWLYFEKAYKVAVQAMPPKSPSVFKDHWLFTQGQRRGIFFGVLSRSYFRVELSVDETIQDDKYKLTRFIFENIERFRNLTWRSSSSEKHIVLGTLKAEYDICNKYGNIKPSIYAEIAKALSLYASVRLIDVISEDDIYNFVYNKMESLIESSNKKIDLLDNII